MAAEWPRPGEVGLQSGDPKVTWSRASLSLFSFSSASTLSLFFSSVSRLIPTSSASFFFFLFSFSFLPILSLSPSFSLFYIPLCYSLLPCMLLLHRGLTLFPLFHHSTILSIFFFSVFFLSILSILLFSLSLFFFFSTPSFYRGSFVSRPWLSFSRDSRLPPNDQPDGLRSRSLSLRVLCCAVWGIFQLIQSLMEPF